MVDDELAIREAMSTLLGRWGYQVVAAGSGEDAVRRLATWPVQPDLAICDYRLRDGESGIEVIERLRSEYNSAIPAMLITGDTAPDRLAEAKANGLLLLHKPVSNSKLRAVIANLTAAASVLRQSRTENAASSASNEPEFAADRRGLGSIDDIQRAKDRGDMRFDRLLGEIERRGDRLVGLTLAQHFEDFGLPFRQPRRLRLNAVRATDARAPASASTSGGT